jgi:hypothetical protein
MYFLFYQCIVLCYGFFVFYEITNSIIIILHTGGSHNSKIGLILGTVGGILGLIIVGALFLICNARRKSHLREVFVDVAGSVPL